MSVIGVVSMKGGVGKTTTTANLASALAIKLGRGSVSVLDLDPQNALRWQLGLPDTQQGVCDLSRRGGDWRQVAFPSPFNVLCLPYGQADEIGRMAFEDVLEQHPRWVSDQLDRAGLKQNALVLIDTPPGPSVYLRQVFACADFILVVLLADAGSYATVPAMQTWRADASATRPNLGVYYVLNQVDRSDPLNRDTAAFLHQQLVSCICPVDIHGDEAVGEALAFTQPVLQYEPHAQASLDMTRLATWVLDMLNR